MSQQLCGLRPHPLGKHGKPVLVDNTYLQLICKMRKGFSADTLVCIGCFNAAKDGFNRKPLAKRTESSILPFLPHNVKSNLDEFDLMITKSPRNPELRAIVKGTSSILMEHGAINTTSLGAQDKVASITIVTHTNNVLPPSQPSLHGTSTDISSQHITADTCYSPKKAKIENVCENILPAELQMDSQSSSCINDKDLSENATNRSRLPQI